MASYNHEKFVRYTIESVVNQTFTDWEFIICDDGSIDSTPKIIQEYADKDKRIHFILSKENIGAYSAIDTCLTYAKGKYIASINSDDMWDENKLKIQNNFLDENLKYGAVFSLVQFIDEENNVKNLANSHPYKYIFNVQNKSRYKWLNEFFFGGNRLCHPSVLIRKLCHDECGVYKKELASLPDFDMWVRICMKYEIYIMHEALTKFRILDNEMNESGVRIENEYRRLIENYSVLKNYLSIQSCEEFLKIFPDNPPFTHTDLIPFYLAQQALTSNEKSTLSFGIHLLYDLLSNEKNAELIRNEVGFAYKDLHILSRNVDLYNIASVQKRGFLNRIINSRLMRRIRYIK